MSKLALPPASSSVPWRLELFTKDPAEVQAQGPFLQRCAIRRLNLPNKRIDDGLFEQVKAARAIGPDIDICAHFRCLHARMPPLLPAVQAV